MEEQAGKKNFDKWITAIAGHIAWAIGLAVLGIHDVQIVVLWSAGIVFVCFMAILVMRILRNAQEENEERGRLAAYDDSDN